MADSEKQFEKRAKALFDDSVEEVDAAALSRLNQGRHRALDELRRPAIAYWGRWAPAAGVAAAAAVAIVMMSGPGQELPSGAAEVATDFEMLLETDSLEMLEDLEFYSVLDAVDAEATGNVG